MGNGLKDITVVVTAAGAPGAPPIMKSLRLNGERKIEIVGTDMNPDAVGLFMAERGHVVPGGTDPEFVPTMLELAEKERADVILPLATYELMPFSENVQRFEEIGVKVPVSKPEALTIANDKGLLCDFVRERGLPAPESVMVSSFKEFELAVEKLGHPEVPVCFKPRIGKGSRGFRVLDPSVDRFDLLMNHKPTHTVTTLDEISPVLSGADPFPELVVMEYLPGTEYSVDLLLSGGEALAVLPRPREVTKLGISFMGRIEKDPEIEELASKIAREIGLEYNINMQFKRSGDGVPKIIEINPRVSGTIVMCTGAGVNLPYLGVKLALGEEIPPIEPKYGTRMIRYWGEIFVDKDGHPYSL
ncbi:MAG: ATP-grasp domain-containing protein [Candidatus Thermoplasmatota archaeon]|nr:ATP-grasp domain-containing protein [Candidatus Thermoplasmatota archaeon]